MSQWAVIGCTILQAPASAFPRLNSAVPCRRFLSACALYGLVSLLEVDMHACKKPASLDSSVHLNGGAGGADIDGGGYDGSNSAPKRLFIDSVILCFLIFSAVALLSKLGCRLLSMRVTGATLFDKLKVHPLFVSLYPVLLSLQGSARFCEPRFIVRTEELAACSYRSYCLGEPHQWHRTIVTISGLACRLQWTRSRCCRG